MIERSYLDERDQSAFENKGGDSCVIKSGRGYHV